MIIQSLVNTVERMYGTNSETAIKVQLFLEAPEWLISEDEKVRALIHLVQER